MAKGLFGYIFGGNNPEEYSNVRKKQKAVLREYNQDIYEKYQAEKQTEDENKAAKARNMQLERYNKSFKLWDWWESNGSIKSTSVDRIYNDLLECFNKGLKKDNFLTQAYNISARVKKDIADKMNIRVSDLPNNYYPLDLLIAKVEQEYHEDD